jgi:nitrite reductase/ring-hydroxylating ferredoxin subunit
VTLRLAIEDAVREAAPEVEQVVAQEEVAPVAGRATWAAVGSFDELAPGTSIVRDDLLFVRLRRSLYAYRPACPGCAASLADATLDGSDMVCSGCGRRYGVAVAGRCRDDDTLHLEPVPLLTGADGVVRVALREAVAA